MSTLYRVDARLYVRCKFCRMMDVDEESTFFRNTCGGGEPVDAEAWRICDEYTSKLRPWTPDISPEEAAKGIDIEVYDPKVHGRIRFRVGTDE